MTIRVLVADDQELVRTGLSMILGAQPDIDIVGEATLADHHDVEVALVMLEALEGLRELGVPPVTIHVNNR